MPNQVSSDLVGDWNRDNPSPCERKTGGKLGGSSTPLSPFGGGNKYPEVMVETGRQPP